MARSSSPELDGLEERIERLRREYDLFLAGERRTEPLDLRGEIERTILKLVASPLLNTADRFRVNTLAHRFRAVEARVRKLLERREARARGAGGSARQPEAPSVVIDRALLERPAALDRYVRRLHQEVERACGGQAPITAAQLREKLVETARAQVTRPGVRAVRFRVDSEGGRPRIRGEILPEPPGPTGRA